jgi:hypothetical protein
MPAKKSPNAKIIDISAPDQTSPDPTSRPVVVTNRPVLTNDPMMVDQDVPESTPGLPTAPVVSRQAKTINPIAAAKEPEAEPTTEKASEATPTPVTVVEADASPEVVVAEKPKISEKPAETTPAPEKEEPEAAKEDVSKAPEEAKDEPAQEAPAEAEPTEEEAKAKHDATDAKEQEVDTARQKELEELIAGGKYVVPINAVELKRARIITITLAVLALVLALVLFDIALDSNALSVPGVPHTNFFRVK